MAPDDLQEIGRTATLQQQPEHRPPSRGGLPIGSLAGIAVLLALGAGIYFGIHRRVVAEQQLTQTTNEAAVPTVEVMHPLANATESNLALPGNMQALSDTALYARTNGYLTKWYFDIGAHVKKGDLLAEIDTPEVDAQLAQNRADLANAQATLALATVNAGRQENLVKTNVASVQDRDNAVTAMNVAKAQVQSRQAAVSQLERLQSFERVEAPFDGTVTARSYDLGALITAGSTGSSRELFHLVDTSWLRIYVSVPEVYSPAMHAGAVAKVTLDEYPGQTFEGVLARTSGSIDQISHTLLVEVDVQNKDGRLLPGSYVHVVFTIPTSAAGVTVPVNTLLFRKDGMQVGVIRDNTLVLVPVKIGHDFGETVEIVSGLQANDWIVINPADSVLSGAKVTVRERAVASAAR